MTERGDADAAAQVEEAVAVDVGDPGAVGVLDVHGEDAPDTAGDGPHPALMDGPAARARHLGAHGGGGQVWKRADSGHGGSSIVRRRVTDSTRI